jgi:Flp pilus assembly protein TadD, contains TPR repeats
MCGHSQAKRMWPLWRQATGCATVWLLLSISVHAQLVSSPKEPKENPLVAAKVLEGRNALESQDFERAVAAFQTAQSLAIQGGNKKWEADCDFYLGLTLQRQAEKLGRRAEAQTAIAESEKFYKRALALRPDSAATLNNLAQLYVQTGRQSEASELLHRAVSLKDQQSDITAQNYAAVLESKGDTASSSQYYAMVAASQPGNLDAYERAVAGYLKADPKGLGGYLWDSLKAGQVLRVQQSAIGALQQREWEPEQRRELLALVAASLSQQSYDPAKYKDTFAAENLGTFAGDAVIGKGVTELEQLHQGSLDAEAFSWWAGAGDLNADPPRGVWPRDAFRSLIRSLGHWYQGREDLKRAEALYRVAVVLNRQEIDPAACLALADLYVAQERVGDVDRLLNEVAPELFYGKGQAYRSSQWRKIYEFHRALGLIYSYLGRWGNNNTPTSAIFQLEHAMDAAARLRIKPEPRLVDSLATAYENTGATEQGWALRLRYAEEYAGGKDYVNATELLAPLGKQKAEKKLNAVTTQRYDRAVQMIPQQRKE